MARTGDGDELSFGHELMQCFASVERYPWIIFTPNDFHRTANIAKLSLDLFCISFVCLSKLAIEARRAILIEPWSDQGIKILNRNVIDQCTLDIGRNHRLVDMGWQALKGIDMSPDMIKEIRSLGTHCHYVH